MCWKGLSNLQSTCLAAVHCTCTILYDIVHYITVHTIHRISGDAMHSQYGLSFFQVSTTNAANPEGSTCGCQFSSHISWSSCSTSTNQASLCAKLRALEIHYICSTPSLYTDIWLATCFRTVKTPPPIFKPLISAHS